MAKLLVLYKTPTDASAFDAYYTETHIPLAKAIPGLRSYEVSRGAVASPAGESGVHLVAILTFDSLSDLEAGLGSPQGQAAAGDLPKFATGGAELLMFETQDA
ncbi:EthD family reductase [Mangrovibrevibacter kandeliae]|uniref:EthD family reductase n=1 Tax=Mangrovibrevibacter kandeliae TaxID=2968473 RepID=UPI00211901F2|nr:MULTISPECIES: EthD family reductase [unclassified Aurantimonas]MCQ8780887.1 EthD family reductase [Aurantimonas sp. CSK15Z-1]MCW4113667.1 EthD family reductase [Aurantimonas sp. MSK8Z-1]